MNYANESAREVKPQLKAQITAELAKQASSLKIDLNHLLQQIMEDQIDQKITEQAIKIECNNRLIKIYNNLCGNYANPAIGLRDCYRNNT